MQHIFQDISEMLLQMSKSLFRAWRNSNVANEAVLILAN